MLKKTEKLPNSRVKLTIDGTAEQFASAFDAELEELSKGVEIAGFRKGKAPRAKVIEKLNRQRIEAGAIDRMVSALYYETARAEKLTPVAAPSIEVTEYTVPADGAPAHTHVLSFTVEVDVMPEVEVKGYDKIKLKKSAPEPVEKAEVDKVVDYLRNQRAVLTEAAPEAAIAEKMWVDIGYDGTIGGVKRSDMHNAHHPLVVGEGSLIPGFEDALIGMKVGEEKTFPVTFPKEYAAQELAGKEAEFTVKVHEIKDVKVPEIDESFAKEFGHDTAAALTEAIEDSLKEEKVQQQKDKQEEEVLEELLKIAKLEVPQSLVEEELTRVFDSGKKRLTQAPGQWEQYLERTGKTAEEVREEMRDQAEKNVRVGLVLGKLVEEEKIERGDKAGREALDRLISIASK
jgi:trigger factor